MEQRRVDRSWARVRRLVDEHPDDWEGQDLAGDEPLRVFLGRKAACRVLVTTKEAVVRRWPVPDRPANLAIVVISGIVTGGQARTLALLATDPSTRIAFVGDANPLSLHAYLSVRAYLGAQRVRFCGICDGVLDAIGDARALPANLRAIELSAFDQAHLRLVEALAPPEQVLGARVAAILRGGKKIELEAISFRGGAIAELFNLALVLAKQRRKRT